MNIKAHIEAGHYPKDDAGRPLVTTAGGETYAIVRTDNGGVRPLVGMKVSVSGATWCGWQDWDETGRANFSEYHLLPPPPRKVKVTAFMAVSGGGGHKKIGWSAAELRDELPGYHIAELTGEYDEPWEIAR